MISWSTYLRQGDGTLLPVDEATEPPTDPDYIEGSIELVVDGVVVLDRSEWDYVDQLWAYLCNMVAEMRSERRAQTYFPDQPIEVSFELVGPKRLLVKCEYDDISRVANADAAEFFESLRTAARKFFAQLTTLVPENPGYETALRKLDDSTER